MQKYLLVLVIALLTIDPTAEAQTSEHLTFKGVAIDGTLKGFVGRMKEKGFTLLEVKDGIGAMKGDFANFRDCYLLIGTLKNEDLVSVVSVIFPEQDSWASLSGNYFYLKDMLKEKYGEPDECIEKFTFNIDDDYLRLQQVIDDNCKYTTTFKSELGSIYLSIEHNGGKAIVMLAYFDRINGELMNEKVMEDL